MIGDPHGIHRLSTLERARLKFHARACGPAGTGWRPVCGSTRYYLIADTDEQITCRLCLYWLGQYVPLSRLREHQAAQRMHAEAWRGRS